MADTLSVREALILAAEEIGIVGKDSQADAKIGGYRFRGVDAVVNATSAVLHKHGIVTVPEVLAFAREQVATKAGGTMMNVVVTERFTFVGPDGDTVTTTVIGEAADAGDKASSKAQSVALRVALLQVLLLPTGEPDPDQSGYERDGVGFAAQGWHRPTDDPWATTPPPDPAPPSRSGGGARPSTEPQQKAVHAVMTKAGYGTREDILTELGSFLGRPIASARDLTGAEASRVIDTYGGPK